MTQLEQKLEALQALRKRLSSVHDRFFYMHKTYSNKMNMGHIFIEELQHDLWVSLQEVSILLQHESAEKEKYDQLIAEINQKKFSVWEEEQPVLREVDKFTDFLKDL